jgi:hypothetical protein
MHKTISWKRNWIDKLLDNWVINVRWLRRCRGVWKDEIKTTYSKCTCNVSHWYCFLHGEKTPKHSNCMRHYTEAVGRIKKDNGRYDTLGFLFYAYCSISLSDTALCRLIQTISHWQRPLPPSLWTHGQMECKGIWGTTLKGKAQQLESQGVWQSIRLLFSVQLLTTATRMFTALTSYRIR